MLPLVIGIQSENGRTALSPSDAYRYRVGELQVEIIAVFISVFNLLSRASAGDFGPTCCESKGTALDEKVSLCWISQAKGTSECPSIARPASTMNLGLASRICTGARSVRPLSDPTPLSTNTLARGKLVIVIATWRQSEFRMKENGSKAFEFGLFFERFYWVVGHHVARAGECEMRC